jgi:hypothetical protein
MSPPLPPISALPPIAALRSIIAWAALHRPSGPAEPRTLEQEALAFLRNFRKACGQAHVDLDVLYAALRREDATPEA